MGLYIGHDSAVRYWLTKTGEEAIPDVAPERTLAYAEASSRLIKGETLPFDCTPQLPLHLLVASKSLCREIKGASTHLFSHKLPVGSFYSLAGSIRIASPELTYLLMAGQCSFNELVELGCYLCGGFSIGEKGYDYTGRREPLTTPEDIKKYLDEVPQAYGVKKARRALRYVVANTASPMEVFLGMEYVLPVRLGGWEMPELAANQRIEVVDELRGLAGTDHLLGDLYIPGVNGNTEYDSYEFHTGRYRLDHTQLRRNVLEAMGVKTVSATYGQVNTAENFDAFMWLVNERFGLGHREFTLEQKEAQHDLYEFLIDPVRPKF